MRHKPLWTAERREILTAMKAKDISNADIALEITRRTGHEFTRRAVSDAVWRFLPARGRANRAGFAFVWTAEAKAVLKERWLAGVSASLIAHELGILLGRTFSRSAICGAVFREGLPARQTMKMVRPGRKSHKRDVRGQKSEVRNQRSEIRDQKEYAIDRCELVVPPAGQCRWIDGDVRAGTARYSCGEPRVHELSSYCKGHHRVVYRS